MLHKVELLMMVLLSEFLASLSPFSSGGLNILLCGYLTNTCNKNMEITMFPLDCHWIILDNHLLLGTEQPEDVVESNCKELF